MNGGGGGMEGMTWIMLFSDLYAETKSSSIINLLLFRVKYIKSPVIYIIFHTKF